MGDNLGMINWCQYSLKETNYYDDTFICLFVDLVIISVHLQPTMILMFIKCMNINIWTQFFYIQIVCFSSFLSAATSLKTFIRFVAGLRKLQYNRCETFLWVSTFNLCKFRIDVIDVSWFPL